MYTRLHVQDSSRSEDIWVYLNDSNILSEKGLIPGNRVRFYGLERKLSQLNNIYCRLVPLSSIQILCTEAESVIIDDSTSVAMVTLGGSSVQNLLQMSHDQWKCLEEEVSQTGEVFIQQFNPTLTTSVERFVYMLCDNHAVKQTWLMTLRTRSSLDINKIGHDEFCMKTFDTGSSRISTQCLPFLQLECVAMNIFEPSVWAIHRLSVK